MNESTHTASDFTPANPGRDERFAGYVVVLVHGTFARGARWAAEGSALRNALRAAYGDATRFAVFEWSGRNSHSARIKAGRELGHFIDDLAERHPAAKLAVISHSHGGNVALYAGRTARHMDRVAGVACLATPFISAAPRSLRSIRVFDGIGRQLGPISSAIPATIVVAALMLAGEPGPWAAAGGIAASLAAGALVYYLLRRIAMRKFARLENGVKRLIGDLAWAPLDKTDVLSLAYRRDEARRFLRVLTATTEWPMAIWDRVAFYSWRVMIYGGGGAVLAGVLTFVLHRLGAGGAVSAFMLSLAGVLISVAYLIAMLALLVHAIARFAPWIRSHPGGFGWGNPAYHAYASIRAVDEPTDLACRSLFHRAIPQGDFDAGSWLGHCEIYEDPRIHRIVVHWLETIALRPDNPPLTPVGTVANEQR